MRRSVLFILLALPLFMGSCGMMQSIVKSTFPYTATLVIPATAETGKSYAAVSLANSFDQNFSPGGNNGNNVSEVSIISARLESTEPADFNLGNIKSVKIYMATVDGKDEILVAQRNPIASDTGNIMALDVDNAIFLDKLVRQSAIKVKMVYELRKKTDADVSLHLILSINAYPAAKK
jgi:hypothetical protein